MLALFAFVVYIPGSWWGAPHATSPESKVSWGVDDETPLGPLAELHNIIEPKADRNYGYPLMYSFIVSGTYAPYLGYLWLTGQWSQVSSTYPFGMEDPVKTLKTMTYIAHFVTVLMGVGIILATFETGRILKNRRAGIFAALFSMTAYPMFYYVRSGNVDVPMLFFVSLTVLVFIKSLTYGLTVKRAVWLGIFAGFALGTKETAIGIFLAMPSILLLHFWHDSDASTRKEFWRAIIIGLLAASLALGVSSGLFVEPSRYFSHIKEILSHIDKISDGAIYIPYVFPFSIEGNYSYIFRVLKILAEMMTLPGLLLAATGIIFILSRKNNARNMVVLVCLYLLFVFFTLRSPQMRYFLPVPYLLAFPAAWIVATAMESKYDILRYGMPLLAIGIIGFNLLRGAGLTHEMIHDSRHEAAEWLASQTEPGDTIEYFGPVRKLPPLDAGVHTRQATPYDGIYAVARTDDTKAREILSAWNDSPPKYILLIPDLTSWPGTLYNSTCPPTLCEGLLDGSLGFPLVARFKTEPLFPWLKLPALDYPTVNPPIHIYAMPNSPEV